MFLLSLEIYHSGDKTMNFYYLAQALNALVPNCAFGCGDTYDSIEWYSTNTKPLPTEQEVVEKDEKEKNLRQVLNLGHTFGHAFEAACNYKKILNHGEAVILGVKTAVKFSLNKKYLSKTTYNKIMMHIEKIDFKLSVNKIFKKKDINRILSFMLNDKKNVSNKINLVLLKGIGSPIINKPFHQSEIKKFFLKELINL